MNQQTSIEHAGVGAAAERLLRAAETRIPCSTVHSLIEGDAGLAYDVQRQVIGARKRAGAQVVGQKIGLTSKAVQEQLGVNRPDYGILLDEMDVSHDDFIPLHRLLQPKVEAEIAFVLGDDLDSGALDVSQCRDAIDHSVAALEIVDSRIASWEITFADTVADNASSGLFVLGKARVDLSRCEPRDVSMSLRVDGIEVSAGSGVECLGDPLAALSWLARTARELGDPLQAGQVILSGALGPMVGVGPGTTVSADLASLGQVSARFPEEAIR